MPNLMKLNITKSDPKRNGVDAIDSVRQQIFIVRGQRVMLDRDLAQLYGVTTKQLNMISLK